MTGPAGFAALGGLAGLACWPVLAILILTKLRRRRRRKNIAICCHPKFDEFTDGKRCLFLALKSEIIEK